MLLFLHLRTDTIVIKATLSKIILKAVSLWHLVRVPETTSPQAVVVLWVYRHGPRRWQVELLDVGGCMTRK